METITVTGKADLGFSPHYGFTINKGQTYEITADQFTDQLFVLPAPEKTKKGGTE